MKTFAFSLLAATLLTPPTQSPPLPASPPAAKSVGKPALTPAAKSGVKTATKLGSKPAAKLGNKPAAKHTLPRKVHLVVRKPIKPLPPPPPPWKQFPLNPRTRVTLDFRNASVDAVLHLMSQASGITIIKDPKLTGGITLQSPRPQSLGDAFAMLNAVLNLKNYEITKQNDFLIVSARTSGGAAAPGAPGPTASAPSGFHPPTGMPGMPTVVAGRPGMMPPGMPMPGAPAAGGAAKSKAILKVYLLHYADATEVARVINDVFAPSTPKPQFPGMPVMPSPPGASTGPAVKASAEDYSNSLIVRAPDSVQTQVAQIIAQIDQAQSQPEQPRVFHLQYAVASDLAPVIENILTGSAPLGRGGPTSASQNQNNNLPFFFFGQQPPSNNAGGTVVADTPTNSLIVTTTADNMTNIAQVIAELDKPAPYKSTTFVFVLKNARADVVANLLNQSFGNRSTNGPVGGSLTNTGLTQNTINTSATSNNVVGNTQPPNLQNNANQGQNTQNANFTQGGFFNGQNGLQNQNNQTTSLDSSGHVVNVRRLMNQVLLVPNIDTNSIIVVAPPEDQGIVRDILKQMDRVPEQVMIETLVVEANLDKTDQLGVEYNFMQGDPGGIHGTERGNQSFGLQGNTGQPQGLRYTLTAAQYQIFLQAVQTDKKFDVLSTPRIFTTNNATAQINISQSLPYVTNQTVETTGTVLYNYNFLDVGIVLTVTPRITSNGHVIMDVTQTANDFVGYTSFNAPIVNQREAQTTVNIADGQTVVLGGIINNSVTDTVSKVPLLGDLPIIGNLFRSTNKDHAKTELLVFLTPHIVKNPGDAQRLREQTEEELGKTTQQMIPAAAKPTAPKRPQ